MSFYGGRDPQPISSLIDHRERKRLAALETPDSDLYAELNRVDLMGERIFARRSSERECLNEVARNLDVSRESLMDALGDADRGGLPGVHMRLASILVEVDSLASDLAGGNQ